MRKWDKTVKMRFTEQIKFIAFISGQTEDLVDDRLFNGWNWLLIEHKELRWDFLLIGWMLMWEILKISSVNLICGHF